MEDRFYDAYRQQISLTAEQQACLKYTGKKTLMVKGYAGAGKSIVLLAIAKKYLDAYKGMNPGKNKIGIFTVQTTLATAMKEVLNINGLNDDSVKVVTISSYLNEIYQTIVKSGFAPRRSYPYNGKSGKERRIKYVEGALKSHRTTYGKHRFHDLPPEFWLEEFDWMKDMNVWTNDESYYLSLPRTGRGEKVHMSKEDRVVAYQIYCQYCWYLRNNRAGDWADQAMYLIRNDDKIPKEMQFDHILVDEAQDISLAQMMAVLKLFKKDMTVAMDINQRILGKNWNLKQLGIESTTRKLTKSMRTTKQIDDLAESIRSINDSVILDDDKSPRAIPERQGSLPNIVHLNDSAAERKYVVNLVKAYLRKNGKITIGIIVSKKSQIRIISTWLTDAGIIHEEITKTSTFSIANPGVKVATVYSAKGLEFNCVIIPMFAEGYFPYRFESDDPVEMEMFMVKSRNLVYVAMTRARQLLTITYYGDKGSRFIKEMQSSLYKFEECPEYEVMKSDESYQISAGQMKKDDRYKPDNKPISSELTIKEFFENKGFEVIDKRYNRGCLWVVGSEEKLAPLVKEVKRKYHVSGNFSKGGGRATRWRPGWFTTSSK